MGIAGMYGIRRTEYRTGDMVCLTCYRSWREDVTPAGRCPWEYQHDTDHRQDVALRRRKCIIAGFWG
jgi:hypothetical protein